LWCGFTCAIAGQVVTCTSTTVTNVHETRTIDVEATVARGASGSLAKTATVERLATGDVAPPNNTSAVSAVVSRGTVPATGAEVGSLLATALGLVLVGGLLVATTRRRPITT
jgi:LPXTG-motif cell wall-anchored protein